MGYIFIISKYHVMAKMLDPFTMVLYNTSISSFTLRKIFSSVSQSREYTTLHTHGIHVFCISHIPELYSVVLQNSQSIMKTFPG